MSVTLYCLNVGQANSLVLLSPSQNGESAEYEAIIFDVGVDGDKLARWLWSVGVRRLPFILLSHNDRDHILGLDALVQGFREGRRIGKIGFVIDRSANDIPYWMAAQKWIKSRIVEDVEEILAPAGMAQSRGKVVFADQANGYWLFCLYPTVFQNQAAVAGAAITTPKPRKGHNATSAVFALGTSAKPKKWRILFGGDLDLPGWHCLTDSNRLLASDIFVVPHHGGPRHPNSAFGFTELANAVSPTYSLISVGTDQAFGHPLPELVRALRGVHSTIVCTQITERCVNEPHTVPKRSILPLPQLTDPTDLATSGTACAGTVAVMIPSNRPPVVLRIKQHQAAIDGLVTNGHHPICRP